MADTVRLAGWPSTTDCVAWSYDNVIAVAIRDSLTLLTPSYPSSRDAELEWKTATLIVGRYTEQEVPLRETLSWSAFSLGEELSERHVTAIKWSPPGLGIFGRSVLAVLTADDILSIWECHGKLDAKHHWRRVLLVNDCLKGYHGRNQAISDQRHGGDSAVYRTSRVKSFCWSPPPELHDRATRLESAVNDRSHLMAVSDDNGGLCILHFRSPHDLIKSAGSSWSVKVISYSSAVADSNPDTSVTRCLPSTFRPPPTIANQLSWSPWVLDSTNSLTSTLAYTVDSILHFRAIQATAGAEGWHVIVSELAARQEPMLDRAIRSPLTWVSKPNQLGTNQLFVLNAEHLLRITLRYSAPQAFAVESRNFVLNPWDQVTSMAVTMADTSNVSVTLTSYGIDLNGSTHAVCLSADGVLSTTTAAWKNQLEEVMDDFGVRHNLSDHVFPKIHGLACSPLEDFSLACATFHPSDGPEYTIAANQETILAISKQSGVDGPARTALQTGIGLPGQLISDSIMPSLIARLKESAKAGSQDDLLIAEDIVQWLALDIQWDPARIDLHFLDEVIHFLRLQILFDPQAVRIRANMLIRIASGNPEVPPAPDFGILKQLVTSICNLPHALHENHAGSTMAFRIHDTILQILLLREQGIQTSQEQPQHQHHETCDMCSSSIAFESLRWSRCQQGHQFSRCCLTFLSIQNPGSSKSCRVCGTQYLDEYKMASLRATPSSHLDPRLAADQSEPLLRVMFSACNVCIYCGGSFVSADT